MTEHLSAAAVKALAAKLPKTRGRCGPEATIQRQCLDLLRLRGIWFVRLNVGGMKGEYKGKPWFVKFGVKGMADVLALVSVDRGQFDAVDTVAVPVWVEIKAEKGKQTANQKAFQASVEKVHAQYWLVKSAAELDAKLTELMGTA